MTTTEECASPAALGGPLESNDEVTVLSTLLLSVLLKLEDREHRIPLSESPVGSPCIKWAGKGTSTLLSEDATLLYDFEDIGCDDDESNGYEIYRDIDTGVLQDGDAILDLHGYITPRQGSSDLLINLSSASSIKSECSTMTKTTSATGSADEASTPQDIVLTSQTGSGDTTLRPAPSVYQESAVRIVSEALVRAIANVFTNGVVRRSVRFLHRRPCRDATVCWENWSTSTNVSNGNGDDGEGCQDGGDYHGVQIVDQSLPVVSEDGNPTKPTTKSPISTDWLLDVNRRIATNQVTADLADLMPPSVASNCDVSRCSSVSVLSSGDRTLKVRATPPVQSKLLWRVVQKMNDGNGTVLKTLQDAERPRGDSQTDVQVSDRHAPHQEDPNLKTEKVILRARLSVGYSKHATEESSRKESQEKDLPAERETSFRESAAQTEDADFQHADNRHSEVDDSDSVGEATVNHFRTPQVVQAHQPLTKTRGLPPAASPFLIDVVWRHASHPDFTSQEMMALKASYAKESVRERQHAHGVVESALHRAVSSLVVQRVISDTVASLSSIESLKVDFRRTPSFERAAADLPGSIVDGFQWYPYLEDAPAEPCKASPPRRGRQGDEKKQDAPLVAKQPSSESSDTYVDARDKFGSSDDLLTQDAKGHEASSDDDDFADAVCDSECILISEIIKTSDKSVQVSSIQSPGCDEESRIEPVQLELPMESINFIKDQFYDIKALVTKYRELLYEPTPVSEVEMEGIPARPEKKSESEQYGRSLENEKVARRKTPEKGEQDVRCPVVRKGEPRQRLKSGKKKDGEVEKESGEIGAPSGSRSSRVAQKQETTMVETHDKDRDEADVSSSSEVEPFESVYEESSSEDLGTASRHKPRVEAGKRRGRDKRWDSSPTKGKTVVSPRKLRKGTTKLRTPAGRSGRVTFNREKTTPDGFLPSKSEKGRPKISPRHLRKQHQRPGRLSGSGKRTAKRHIKQSASSPKTENDISPETDDISPENAPKVKNRISFFERISRHNVSGKDGIRPSKVRDRTLKLNTPVKEAVSNMEKLEKMSTKVSKERFKDEKGTDGKRHINFKHHREKLHSSQKDGHKRRDGTVVAREKSGESGIDSSPGKGIWKNAAFFEALGKTDEPKVKAERPPARVRKILEEGLFDETAGAGKDETTEDYQPAPDEDVERCRFPTVVDKGEAESSPSTLTGKKARLRNKNANNQTLVGQLVSPDSSCISSSRLSEIGEIENVDRGLNTMISTEKDDSPETEETEEPYTTAREENNDEAALCPCKSTNSEDLQIGIVPTHLEELNELSQSTSCTKESDGETNLTHKSSSDVFVSLEAKSSADPCTETAHDTLRDSCESMQSATPEGRLPTPTAEKLSEDVWSSPVKSLAGHTGQLQDEAGLEQKSSAEMVGEPGEDETERSETGSCLLQHDHQQVKVMGSSPMTASRPRTPTSEEENNQAKLKDQSHPLNASGEVDDVDSLDHLLSPLSTSSPLPRKSFMSSDSVQSANTDGEAIGVVGSPRVPGMDEVLRTFRNASFLRACNPEDGFSEDTEDNFITCDDADDPQDIQGMRGATSVADDNLQGTTIFGPHADASPKSSPYYTAAVSKENTPGDADDVSSSEKKLPDQKLSKKKRWRCNFFQKRKRFKTQTKKEAPVPMETGEQSLTGINRADDKTDLSPPADKAHAITLATSAGARVEAETPASVGQLPVPSQKRKFTLGSPRRPKKHKTSKNL
ncbi:uncharacterized protein LOC110977906 [Acanthaster planci]|uniref:Uncharacterized protein LOC110977906 n=1 Tax=Acanthaster planci TaxID=133434 RepID=A0A8B7Y4L1_ACAPL|nr:uncharacterized protein LOC110977906 [Acanthaster planci]